MPPSDKKEKSLKKSGSRSGEKKEKKERTSSVRKHKHKRESRQPKDSSKGEKSTVDLPSAGEEESTTASTVVARPEPSKASAADEESSGENENTGSSAGSSSDEMDDEAAEIAAREKILAEKEAALRARIAAKKAAKVQSASQSELIIADGAGSLEPAEPVETESATAAALAKPAESDNNSMSDESAPAVTNETRTQDDTQPDDFDQTKESQNDEQTTAPEDTASIGAQDPAGDTQSEVENTYEYPNEYYDDNGEFVGNPDVLAWATTLYAYKAGTDSEITFREGDLIGILEYDNEGWMRGDYYGYVGSFPSSYVQVYDDQNAEEVVQRKRTTTQRTLARREERDVLVGEMREMKGTLEQKESIVSGLEAEIQALSERKQQLQKALRAQRSNSSDDKSVLLDLLKLAYDMDVEKDAFSVMASTRARMVEELSAFSGDLAKEAKQSPGVGVYSQNLGSKLASLRTAGSSAKTSRDAADIAAATFREKLNAVIVGLSD